jgi:hypothetical protein
MPRSFSRSLFLFTLVPAVFILAPLATPAHASFTPLTCPPFQYNFPVPVNIGATRFDRSATNGANYINNTLYSWNLMVNPNVSVVNLHTPGFVTESGFDFFQVTFNGGSTFKYTGTVADSSRDFVPIGQPSAEKTLGLLWNADISVMGTPPTFDVAKFRCSGVNPAINNLTVDKQGYAEGLLMDTTDAIYFSVNQPALTSLEISLEGLNTAAGTDFDIFASPTVATPDASNATWTSTSGAPNEMLKIPSTLSSRTIFVGVFAFHGGGHFSVHATSQSLFSGGLRTLKVCTPGFSIDTNAATFPVLKQMLQNTSLRMLAASHGNLWINAYNIVQIPVSPGSCANNADFCASDSTCNICMNRITDVDGCTIGQSCGSVTRIANIGCAQYANGSKPNVQFSAFVWAHEWGHSLMGFTDERLGNGNSICGHTLMNNPSNSNFWCNGNSHCKDGVSAPPANDPRCVAGQDNWSLAPSNWIRATDSTEPDVEIFNNWNQVAMDSVTVTKM